ncbi:MAG: hypothetical protein CMB20_000635 [Methanobacteriota archaeon]|nr:MAG: hypothetical protein CMB20_000635 [Euryarchaeota archaeon]
MTEEIIQESNQVGFLDLIKNMLSARTLPHIVMIGILSFVLLLLVDTQENFVSFGFIALSISYAIIAAISNNNTMQKLITLPEDNTGSKLFIRLMMSFRITIVPILLASVIVGLLWYGLGGNDNEWVSPMLASLFIVWSIAQAASFRTGMVEWLSNGLGDAKLHTYKEKISTASQFIVVQSFAFAIIWIGQAVSDAESLSAQDALMGGIAFLLISTLLQVFTLWISKTERENLGVEKGMAAFSFKWMIIAQLFITWHAFSVYRRTWMNPSEISTLIEEGILMATTVVFAVWSLTTYTVRDGKRLISENASLPLGISFGYAYAGSVAMLTGTFDSLREVMIFGHILTICAMILLIRPTLRASRISKDILHKAKNIDITTEPNEDDSENEESTEEVNKDWQENEKVDWENKTGIESETEWDSEEDIEVVD